MPRLAPPAIALAAALAVAAPAGSATFARDFYGSCMASPEVRSLIRSKGGGIGQRRTYCRCFANYLAPTISTLQVTAPQPPPSTLMARARRHCLPRAFR